MAERQGYSKPGTSLVDLEQACPHRLSDADALLAAGCFSAAVAQGVYALEIGLKIRICKCLDLLSLPKAFEIHDLQGLMVLTGLSSRLATDRANIAISRNFEEIQKDANKVSDNRYKGNQSVTRAEAEEFFARLRDEKDGVLTWILTEI